MFDFANDHPQIAIVLLDGFSTLSFGSIAEPLRFVADEYPKISARMELVSVSGMKAVSKGGITIECDYDIDKLISAMSTGHAPQGILFCSGTEHATVDRESISRLLRLAYRVGITTYAIGGITNLIAELGFLRDSKATIHWKSLAAFSELHVDVKPQNTLFVTDELIGSCAGELATLDLVINLIAVISPMAADAAANHFLVSTPRCGEAIQPGSQITRLRNAPQAVAYAAKVMAEHIEDALKIQDIAKICEVSSRKLERQFQDHLGTSPLRYYRSLKLERALELVSQTNLTIQEIALASGFASTGTLTKHFRSYFNKTPTMLRQAQHFKHIEMNIA